MKRAWGWLLMIVFLAAWFLPVVNEPYHTPQPTWLPGWDAFLVALGLNDNDATIWSIASALTNGLMVAAIVWVVRSLRYHVPRYAGWLLAAAALLNLAWAWPAGPPEERIRLSVGYWLWSGTFFLASALLFLASRRSGRQPAA